MNVSKYEAFVTVAETGSITKAAKLLKYSQPGITHMIRSLENDLGFSILKRQSGKYIVTEDGKKILYYCNEIIRNEKDLKNTAFSINGMLTGNMIIGAFNSMILDFVADTIADFSQVYPNIDITLLEKDCDEMPIQLTNGNIEFAFMNSSAPKGFHFIPLFRDKIGLIAHISHPFAQYEFIHPRILNGCSFIMPASGSYDVVEAVNAKAPFEPSVRHYVNSDAAGISLVSRNLGVGVISSLQKRLLTKDVVYRELDGTYGRNLGLVIKSLEYATPAVKEFILFARKNAEKLKFERPDLVSPIK